MVTLALLVYWKGGVMEFPWKKNKMRVFLFSYLLLISFIVFWSSIRLEYIQGKLSKTKAKFPITKTRLIAISHTDSEFNKVLAVSRIYSIRTFIARIVKLISKSVVLPAEILCIEKASIYFSSKIKFKACSTNFTKKGHHSVGFCFLG